MSNPQTEELRRAAHNVAEVLYEGEVGGECYHGERHTCFAVQGRKPLALYKVEEMCERCAAAWHAAMAATLLDSLVIAQRFMNGASVVSSRTARRATSIELDLDAAPAKRGRLKKRKTKGAAQAPVKSNIDGKYGTYTNEEKARILVDYATVEKKSEKAIFLAKYGLKAWHLSGWRKRNKGLQPSRSPRPKTKASKAAKRAKPDEEAYPCTKCDKEFSRRNSKTMHERYCTGA